MLGKAKCKILKQIRQKIADENDIPYVTRECTYQGDCSGTCPRCEAELKALENQLLLRQKLGKAVTVTALCMGIAAVAVGCTPRNGDVLAGEAPIDEEYRDDQFGDASIIEGYWGQSEDEPEANVDTGSDCCPDGEEIVETAGAPRDE